MKSPIIGLMLNVMAKMPKPASSAEIGGDRAAIPYKRFGAENKFHPERDLGAEAAQRSRELGVNVDYIGGILQDRERTDGGEADSEGSRGDESELGGYNGALTSREKTKQKKKKKRQRRNGNGGNNENGESSASGGKDFDRAPPEPAYIAAPTPRPTDRPTEEPTGESTGRPTWEPTEERTADPTQVRVKAICCLFLLLVLLSININIFHSHHRTQPQHRPPRARPSHLPRFLPM